MGFVHITTSLRNDMADLVTAEIDSGSGAGYIEIYEDDGDGIPASANVAITDQTLLGTLTFSDPSFGAASAGVITASSITGETSADATGTAAWARIFESAGSTVVCDVDVGATGSGATIELSSTAVTAGGTIDITSFAFTMPDGT